MYSLLVAPVPAPLPLIDGLHGLTFVLHTAVMNIMLACAFALAWGGRAPAAVRQRAASILPVAMSLTITLGVAPLLFVQLIHGERLYASSIHMAWPWILSLLALMGAYYAAYACEGRIRREAPAGPLLSRIPLLGLLTFSFVLACNMALSERPAVLQTLGRPGWSLAWAETHAPIRWAHEVVGAVALGSLLFLALGHRLRTRGEDAQGPTEARTLERYGLGVLVIATAFNVMLGTGQLLLRPSAVGGAAGGASLGTGILLGLATPVAAWRYTRQPSRLWLLVTIALALGTLTAKTVLRFAMRARNLATDGPVAAPETIAGTGPILLFAVCLLAAVASLIWLGRLALRAAEHPVDGLQALEADAGAQVRGDID